MGIDYIIARSCPVKDTLGDYFLVLLKKQAKLKCLEALHAEDAAGAALSGPELLTIREEIVPLEEWQEECAECGVNFGYYPGGCWCHIPYPIPGLVEKLLITTVQNLVEEEPANRAAEILETLPEAGRRNGVARDWRKNGLTELTVPPSYNRGFLKRQKVTTDQLLEIIFNGNLLEGEKLSRITSFLEYFQRQTRESFVKAVAESKKVAGHAQRISDTLQPFWQFTKACQIADELQEAILVIP